MRDSTPPGGPLQLVPRPARFSFGADEFYASRYERPPPLDTRSRTPGDVLMLGLRAAAERDRRRRRWQLDGAAIASGQTYTPTAAQAGHSLTCSETVTYGLPLFVTEPAATSAGVRVVGPPALAPKSNPPVITGLRQSAARWREGRKPARISARRKAPVGTAFSFVLSEQARVRLAFVQHASGRKVGGRCVTRTPRNAGRRACRLTLGGAVSLGGHAGANRVSFQGRLSSHKRLSLGSYTMTITAVDGAGLSSVPRALRFTIVR